MSHVRAMLGNVIVAESGETVEVEGNYYFPKKDINFDYLSDSETTTLCPWKGSATYYSVEVEGQKAVDGCWTYLTPSDEARQLTNHFAFWGDVKVVKESSEERQKVILSSTSSLVQELSGEDLSSPNKSDVLNQSVKNYMDSLGEDALTYLLPVDYINDTSFFNYSNSTNACFHADNKHVLIKTNPTFNWAFEHLGSAIGQSFEDFLSKLELIDIEMDEILKTLKSHGWVKVPKIRLKHGNKILYYSLDVAITKHGDLDSLSGIQGQFIDITKEQELSQSVEDLLNNVGEGFLSFCETYKVQTKYSSACDSIFNQKIASKNILDLLFPTEEDADKKKSHKEAFDLVFSGSIDFEMLRSVFVTEVFTNEKWLHIDYRWIPKSENRSINRIMLIITDITKEKELEEKLREDEAKQKAILKVVNDREGYVDMQTELQSIFDQIYAEFDKNLSDIDANSLFRYFHTIKGGGAVYSFTETVTSAHHLEGKLESVRSGESRLTSEFLAEIKNDSVKLEESFKVAISEMNETLGISDSDEKLYKVSKSKMNDIIAELKSNIPNEYLDRVEAFEQKIIKEPIDSVLKKYKSAAVDLGSDLGKEIEVDIKGGEVEIDKERLLPLFNGLIHLVRNLADHGIEDSETRIENGKDEVGKIQISASEKGHTLTMVFQDDGGGINAKAVLKSAIEKEVVDQKWADSASEDEIVKLILHPGFSTKEEVSDISGRGVGMDAVKACVDDLGGSINIKTELNKGSVFTIVIP